MSLPSVHEADAISIPPNGNGLALQSQRSGMMSAFTRHKLLVFFMLFCGLGFGYLQYLRTPVLYQSSTSILLIQQQAPMTHMATGISYENPLSTQMQIARSPEIVKRALNPELYVSTDNRNSRSPDDEDDILESGKPATDSPGESEAAGEVTQDTEVASGQPATGDDVDGENDETAAGPEVERRPTSIADVPIEKPIELRTLPTFVGDSNINSTIVESTATSAINDDMFLLTFTGPDPADCPKVLEALTAAYEKFIEEEYASTGKELLELLENARTSLSDELRDRNEAYRQYTANSPLIQSGEETPLNPHTQNIEAIFAQKRAVEDRIRDIELSIDAVERFRDRGGSLEAFQLLMSEMPLGEFRNEEAAMEAERKQLRTQIEDLEFEDQQLSFRLGVDHPDRQRIAAQIALLQRRLRDVEAYESAPPADRVAIWLEALQSQLELARDQLKELETRLDVEKVGANQLRVQELEDAEYRAAIDSAEQLYNSVLRQIDEINLMDNLDRVRIRILAEPERGEQVQPVFSTIMTTAGALGILVGLVFGYLLERADASFRSPDEIRGELSIPVIGHIPTFPDRLRLKNPDTKLDKSLWSFHRPGGSIAEAFKGIRTSLQFNRHDEVHQVLMVTSPSPGEGKSTVSANLAVSLAHLGKKVLLLDADLRRATQPRLFGMLEEPGLTNVLVDDVEPFDVIQPTEVEGLSLLAGGRQVRNPSELLSSPKMAELIKVLREQYDYVLIDTPPVLVVTDPLTVAPLADAVIGVLKLSRRTRREATATIERIIDVGGEMLGIVVNGLESGMGYGTGYGHGGYQYTYGYGYGYGRYYSQHDENGPASDDQRRRITVT